MNIKTKTPPTIKDELDEKLDKCQKWAKFIIASNGVMGFGALVYDSEEECQKNIDKNIYVSGNPVTIGAIVCIRSKPNRQGDILKFIEDGKNIIFPYPLLD